MNAIIVLMAVILLSILAMRRTRHEQPRNRKGRWAKQGFKETKPVYYGDMIKAVKSGKKTKLYD